MSKLRTLLETYFKNPTAKRDFRSQFRGGRSLLSWLFYLGILGFTCVAWYSSTGNNSDIFSLQSSLKGLYSSIMGVVGFLVCAYAGVLNATAVVTEKERKSLELILSSPVTPTYYLMGKLLHAARYSAALLLISIPFFAFNVSVGGSNFEEVLTALVMIFISSVFYSALGLTISCIARNTVQALIGFFAASVTVMIGSTLISLSSFGPRLLPPLWFTSPWVPSALPYMGLAPADLRTGVLFGALYASYLLILLMLGSASALSHYNSRDTKILRIWFALGIVAFPLVLAKNVASLSRLVGPGGGAAGSNSATAAIFMSTIALGIAVPYVCCWHYKDRRKFIPDGFFKIKNIFSGTPSGGAPYIAVTAVITLTLVLISSVLSGTSLKPDEVGSVTLWMIGHLTFFYGLSAFASSINTTIESARALTITLFVLYNFSVIMGLTILSTRDAQVGDMFQVLVSYGAVMTNRSDLRLLNALVQLTLGILLVRAAWVTHKRKIRTREAYLAGI